MFLFVCLLGGCIPARENPKYLFSQGEYRLKSGNLRHKAYLIPETDKIKVFAITPLGTYDSGKSVEIFIADQAAVKERTPYSFTKWSFDVDVISIPLKFRPGVTGFPAQLNTSLNGGIFLGRRADVYKLSQKINALGAPVSTIQHYGVSLGIFSGIGSSVMNPSVTSNLITTEYDAVIIPVGLNILLGYNNLTFGIAVGLDQMLSEDRKYWIYRKKPWLGLTIGLNLN